MWKSGTLCRSISLDNMTVHFPKFSENPVFHFRAAVCALDTCAPCLRRDTAVALVLPNRLYDVAGKLL